MGKTNEIIAFPFTDIEDAESNGLLGLPVSASADLIYRTLGTDGKLNRLKEDRFSGYTLTEKTVDGITAVRIEAVKGDRSITLELGDIAKLLGSRKGVKKFFLWILAQINRQAYSIDAKTHMGTLRSNVIEFTTRELADAGLYTNTSNAGRGFDAAAEALTNLKVKGQEIDNVSGKQTVVLKDILVLFTRMRRDGRRCIVTLNPEFSWGFLLSYYTVIPKFAFGLSLKAFDLIYCIFFLARQHSNTDQIAARGRFAISMRTIQRRLGLPSEIGNTHPGRDIIQPIKEAITEIQNEARKAGFTGLNIKLKGKGNPTIEEFLNKWELEITLTEYVAEKFLKVAHNRENAIAKQERIEEKAAINAKTAIYKKQLEKEAKEARKKKQE